MTKLSHFGPVADNADRITEQIVAAQKEADAARKTKKAAKAAFREARKLWKEARRAAKAARLVVKELKAELSVWAVPDSGLKRSRSGRTTKRRSAALSSTANATVAATNGASEH